MLNIANIMSRMSNTIASPLDEGLSALPHREKVAWLSLLAIFLSFGPYFTLMALDPPTAPLPDVRTMTLFAVTVGVQLSIQIAGQVWFRVRSPEDARAQADERDRAIARRSVGAAYYVLIVGMIVVGCVMPFNSGGWHLINAALAAIVLAEVVHYGLAAWGYRRGWDD